MAGVDQGSPPKLSKTRGLDKRLLVTMWGVVGVTSSVTTVAVNPCRREVDT